MYYVHCDICGKDMSTEPYERRKFTLRRNFALGNPPDLFKHAREGLSTKIERENLDMCDECYKKFSDFIEGMMAGKEKNEQNR